MADLQGVPEDTRNRGWGGVIISLLVIGILAAMVFYVSSLSPDMREELFYKAQEFLPIVMFVSLACLLFTGFPVAFILGGLAIAFGLIGYFMEAFRMIEFFNFLPRIWGGAAENLVLVAVPAFVFMGVMMERSGIANDLLYCVQVLLKRVPGALALAVTIMGTILAAMTGIIGASVTMMTALALPTMIKQGYSHALSCGVIAASGTLGILIPPSIMLIIMADLLAISVGDVFMAAIVPGLGLSLLYLIYVTTISGLYPSIAPPLDANALSVPRGELWSGFTPWSIGALLVTIGVYFAGSSGAIHPSISGVLFFLMIIVTIACFVGPLLRRAFLPPVALITLIKGSILMGFATPSEAGAVGAMGAMILALIAGRLNWSVLEGVCHASARTIAMIFFIIVSATCFAYVYRSLGGDDIVEALIHSAGLDSWGFLFLLMGIAFVLGFFLDWIEITLIVLPVFAPMVAGLDFGDHVAKADVMIWFTVLMAINLQTSFLTPPFGFALFYLKGIAPKEIRIQSVYYGIIPFVILQLTALILVINYPQLAMWLVHFD